MSVDLDRLEVLCAFATPGPWRVVTTTFHSCVAAVHGLIIGAFGMASYGDDPPNATFIAEARTALPDLIAECRQLRATQATMDALHGSMEQDSRYWRERWHAAMKELNEYRRYAAFLAMHDIQIPAPYVDRPDFGEQSSPETPMTEQEPQ